MKTLASISLIFLFLAPVVTKTGIWLWYESNKDEIAMKFCVNKDNPDMECHGQCHMKETMQKVEIKLDIENGKEEAPQKENTEDRSVFDLPSAIELAHSNATLIQFKTVSQVFNYTNPYRELECPPPEMSV